MFKKTPPYQVIGWVGAVGVVVTIAVFSQFFAGRMNSFWTAFTTTLSVATLLMFCVDIYQKYTDWQAGHLFPMRNATFFVVGLSVVALPLFGVYAAVTGYSIGLFNLLLIPVFLWMAVRNLFYVKIDSVLLEVKNGFRPARTVPLFDVRQLIDNDSNLIVRPSEGADILLLRPFFFAGVWERMVARLREVAE